MFAFHALAQQCAPAVHPTTLAAILRVESTFHPFAIGVVDGRLVRQPTNQAEAVATAKALAAAGYNFSLGMGQVNRYNLHKYGLDYRRAFEPCANLHAASLLLQDCYIRAKATRPNEQDALRAAISCYYSGNFVTGLRPYHQGQPSYVQKVLNSADTLDAVQPAQSRHVVPLTASKASTAPFPRHLAPAIAVLPRNEVSTAVRREARLDPVMVYR